MLHCAVCTIQKWYVAQCSNQEPPSIRKFAETSQRKKCGKVKRGKPYLNRVHPLFFSSVFLCCNAEIHCWNSACVRRPPPFLGATIWYVGMVRVSGSYIIRQSQSSRRDDQQTSLQKGFSTWKFQVKHRDGL